MGSVESGVIRQPARGRPKVVAVFAYRYDAQLVPATIQNVSAFSHAWVAFDDRGTSEALSHEPFRRNALLTAARDLGADWIIAIDPDERFEPALVDRIDGMLDQGTSILWEFNVREMFTPDAYRADGLWGAKTKVCLFPTAAATSDLDINMHGRWVADTSGYTLKSSGLNLYHLRMQSPFRRKLRRETYAAYDPDRVFQRVGYDYLDDERGMVLEKVPEDRRYLPVHVEDGQSWAPEVTAIGEVVPDPVPARLHCVAAMRKHGGARTAGAMLEDVLAAHPNDPDLLALKARLALESGAFAEVDDIVAEALRLDPRQAFSLVTRAQARLARYDTAGARQDIGAALEIAPDSRWLQHLSRWLEPGVARFARKNAVWRRWVTGSCQLHEGSKVAKSDMAVVVLGFRASEAIADAVQSLRDQGTPAEIVVVNSGGGDLREVLRKHLAHIRLIEIDEPLYVGAARNIGIDASNAPCIAFLAADCRALPGWVENRLARHRAGALAVSTPVVPLHPKNNASIAVSLIHHARRHPDTPAEEVLHFGQSCSRAIVAMFGYFAPGLRISEDRSFNGLFHTTFPPVWAPEVKTTHAYPTTIGEMVRDTAARGLRRAQHTTLSRLALAPDAIRQAHLLARERLKDSLDAATRLSGLGMARLAWVHMLQRLALAVETRGILKELRQHRQAIAAPEADPIIAARLAQAASPQDWRCEVELANVLRRADAVAHQAEIIAALRRAISLVPQASQPSDALFAFLLNQGMRREALFEAETAVISAPQIGRNYRNAARIALRQKRADLARLHALGSFVLNPDDVAAHEQLAAAHELSGRADLGAQRRAMAVMIQSFDAALKRR